MADRLKELTIKLPESLVVDLGGDHKATEATLRAVVLDQVRAGRISTGKGAELLHMTRHEFLDLMDAHDVPAIDYSPENLAYEMEGLRKLLGKAAQK